MNQCRFEPICIHYITTQAYASQDGSSKVLTSFVSCSKVVCSNGKAGYTLPGQCCESCSESSNFFLYFILFYFILLPFIDFDIGFDTLIAVGASSDAPTTSLKPTWGEWSNWTECSRTCGGGRQSRVRECLSNGRTTLNCTGSRVDVQACNTQCCPGLCVCVSIVCVCVLCVRAPVRARSHAHAACLRACVCMHAFRAVLVSRFKEFEHWPRGHVWVLKLFIALLLHGAIFLSYSRAR